MAKKIYWCKNCLNMSTRNRISFDERGWCNACQWMEEKKTLDWTPRLEELKALTNKYRSKDGGFDCIVPVSGGKDGSYVAYMLKHKFGMNPLAVTVRPALSLALGDQNLKNFIDSGYDHIHLSPNTKAMQKLNKFGFIEKGFPYYGWLIAIKAAVLKTALKFDIPLVFYGEDGEVEYGGSTESKNRSHVDVEYVKRIYFEGGYEKVFKKVFEEGEISDSELYFFNFPTDEELNGKEIIHAHWSYFENWDSYRNYVIAKEHCNLLEKEEGNTGTFTNFSQNDQALYNLHVYLMYLKYGFGRATQDAGIEIRRGAMDREQALNLVRMYDNSYPEEYIELYLNYYDMTLAEFNNVLDKYANTDLFEKVDGKWEPKFSPGEEFTI